MRRDSCRIEWLQTACRNFQKGSVSAVEVQVLKQIGIKTNRHSTSFPTSTSYGPQVLNTWQETEAAHAVIWEHTCWDFLPQGLQKATRVEDIPNQVCWHIATLPIGKVPVATTTSKIKEGRSHVPLQTADEHVHTWHYYAPYPPQSSHTYAVFVTYRTPSNTWCWCSHTMKRTLKVALNNR